MHLYLVMYNSNISHSCERKISFSLQDGRTPLGFAAGFGHADCVNMLLDRGANIDHQTKVGRPVNIMCSKSLIVWSIACACRMWLTHCTHNSCQFLRCGYEIVSKLCDFGSSKN